MSLFRLTGSLRLGNGLGVGSSRSNPAGLAEGDNSPPYMESLVKLFPAEGVALVTFVPGIAAGKIWLSAILVLVLAALIVLIRQKATRPVGGGSPDWIAVGIAVISFILYSMTIGVFGTFLDPPERHALLMSFISGIWIMAVPFFPKKS